MQRVGIGLRIEILLWQSRFSADHHVDRMIVTIVADDGEEYFVRPLAVIMSILQFEAAEIDDIVITQVLEEAVAINVATASLSDFNHKASGDVALERNKTGFLIRCISLERIVVVGHDRD